MVLPGLLVSVGVATVGAVKCHVHVLGLNVTGELALCVFLIARFAKPTSPGGIPDEKTARYQVIIRIFVGIYICKRRGRGKRRQDRGAL